MYSVRFLQQDRGLGQEINRPATLFQSTLLMFTSNNKLYYKSHFCVDIHTSSEVDRRKTPWAHILCIKHANAVLHLDRHAAVMPVQDIGRG